MSMINADSSGSNSPHARERDDVSRRPDPWPAVTDLFAALLLATFGGLILFTHLAGPGDDDPLNQEARRIVEKVRQGIETALAPLEVRDCGKDDVCLDVPIEFGREQFRIEGHHLSGLRQACANLVRVLSEGENRQFISIMVEGHTDDLVSAQTDPLDEFLVNWRFSAQRSGAVLYEFRECGLSNPNFQIQAVAYADTSPVCSDKTEDCRRRNRRTTFRLRPNREAIQKWLEKQER
jgi:hypothetical protein